MNTAKLCLIIATIGFGLVACNPSRDAARLPADTNAPAYVSTQIAVTEDGRVWTIPDELGASYELAGELSPGDEETVRLFLEGLTNGSSPSASSRRVVLKLACEGTGSSALRWLGELSCGDTSTVYLTAEDDSLPIFFCLPLETQAAVTYTLQVSLHLPY